MQRAARYRPGRRNDQRWAWLIVALLAAGVWLEGQGLPIWDHDGSTRSTVESQAGGRAVSPRNVVDGDTLRMTGGQSFRLVGFDTPESGRLARCAHERDLAARATARLQSLIRTAGRAELTPVQCACRPGTEGTADCNYGRSCGTLRVDGRDVGGILISEGLARSYACGATGCPPRRPWC